MVRFEAVLAELRASGIDPGIVHAANSAATLVFPETRFDLVRCGIAVYGIPPAPELAGVADLRPALTLASEVSFVKHVGPGEPVSYGHRQRTTRPTVVATVPVGYADGVFRSLPLLGQEVLIGGVRRPMLGVVTMDQLMVDCGPDADVEVGRSGGAARRPGRRAHHARRVGGPARHDLVRGRVRHRRPRGAEVRVTRRYV